MVGWNEAEAAKKHRPPGLIGVELFNVDNVLDRLSIHFLIIVDADNEGVFCSLQPVKPFLQSQFNSKKLPVPYMIVLLSRISDGHKRRIDGVSGLRRTAGTGPRQRQNRMHRPPPQTDVQDQG